MAAPLPRFGSDPGGGRQKKSRRRGERDRCLPAAAGVFFDFLDCPRRSHASLSKVSDPSGNSLTGARPAGECEIDARPSSGKEPPWCYVARVEGTSEVITQTGSQSYPGPSLASGPEHLSHLFLCDSIISYKAIFFMKSPTGFPGVENWFFRCHRGRAKMITSGRVRDGRSAICSFPMPAAGCIKCCPTEEDQTRPIPPMR